MIWGSFNIGMTQNRTPITIDAPSPEPTRFRSADWCDVGITEEFEESLIAMYRFMGWETIVPWRRGPHAPGRVAARDKLTPDNLPIFLRKRLERLLEADITLYEQCRREFQQKFNVGSLGQFLQIYKDVMGEAV